MYKQKGFRCFLLLCCIICLVYASAQSADYGKQIVKKLSGKSFKGRGYTQRGDHKAAAFLCKQFQKLALIPFQSNGGVYAQPYTVRVNYFPGKMQVRLDDNSLKPGIDYLVDAISPSLVGRFPIVRGDRKALLDSSSLFGLVNEARRSFLYFDNSDDSTETSEEKKVIAQNQKYLQADAALPIKGLLCYSPHKLTWTVLPNQLARPTIELHTPISKETATVDVDIKAQLDTAYATQNIAGFVKGTVYPDSFIVITAHYDHLGKMGRSAVFPGANDNASGTGFVLNLAKYFSTHRSPYSVVFILFSGEELGLKGSEYFVSHPLFDLKKIKFLWNFDMAGTGAEGIQVVNSTLYPKQFAQLRSINDSLHLLKDIKLRGAVANSDHYWFYKQGVPCFFSYTLGGVNYHDVNDTYSTLPFDAWDNYLKLVERFMESL